MMILTLNSCTQKQTKTPIPQQLIEETVAFVSPDKANDWTIDCGGVWVGQDLILTAYHCTPDAKLASMTQNEIFAALLSGEMPNSIGATIYFAGNQSFDVIDQGASSHHKGLVIATDELHDLALIRAYGWPAHREVVFAKESPQIGDEITTIGHPNGLSYSYTRGYVSGFHSGIKSTSIDTQGPFIQINAIVVGGNSGGGVFNSKGHLIGICSFTDSKAIQQGFIIPLGTIKKLMEEYQKKARGKK